MILPKVSIMVIVYNQVEVISETIMSCINQDYENYEIVISDDGSTDGTVDVLKSLALSSNRIKLILNRVNQGIVANSNIALSNCSGEFIAFMGGDDILYREKIRLQAEALISDQGAVICYHPCDVMENGVITHVVGHRRKDLVKTFYDFIAKYGADIPGPSPMLRKNAIPSEGFDTRISAACDWLMFIKTCKKGYAIRLKDTLAIYRKHSGNIGKKIFSYADNFLYTLDIVESEYGDDPKVVDSSQKGKKRFLLGIIFNSILSENHEAFKKYTDIYTSLGGKLFYPALIVWHMRPFKRLIISSRSLLKKYF